MSIFEYDVEKEMRLFRKAEREEALIIFITTLKNLTQPLDIIYSTVISHEIYQNVTMVFPMI